MTLPYDSTAAQTTTVQAVLQLLVVAWQITGAAVATPELCNLLLKLQQTHLHYTAGTVVDVHTLLGVFDLHN